MEQNYMQWIFILNFFFPICRLDVNLDFIFVSVRA